MAVDDPRAWFDSLPDDVVALWDAYYRIEPFGNDYHRHAEMCEILEHIYAVVVNRGMSSRANMIRPRKRRVFFPPDYVGQRERKARKTTIGQQLEEYAQKLSQ